MSNPLGNPDVAADQLERLVPVIKEMIIQLRTGDEPQSYAAVYWLRREMSRIVADMGAGAPNIAKVEAKYRSFMQDA